MFFSDWSTARGRVAVMACKPLLPGSNAFKLELMLHFVDWLFPIAYVDF